MMVVADANEAAPFHSKKLRSGIPAMPAATRRCRPGTVTFRFHERRRVVQPAG